MNGFWRCAFSLAWSPYALTLRLDSFSAQITREFVWQFSLIRQPLHVHPGQRRLATLAPCLKRLQFVHGLK